MIKRIIALIGKGYWGSKIEKYIPSFFDLKYSADSKFDLDIIWNDPDITAVIIATPIDTHYKIVREAILHKKHVFVEKPITLSSQQAEELKSLAFTHGVKIAVEYIHTFSHGLHHLVSAAKNKAITFIDINAKHLGRFLDFDVYWLLASHCLSVLSMFRDLKSMTYKFIDLVFHDGLCTTGVIECYWKNIQVARIMVSLNYHPKQFSVDIYGDGVFMRYSPNDPVTTSIIKYNKVEKALPPELITSEKNSTMDELNNLRLAMKYFKDLLEGFAPSNLETAIQITSILEKHAGCRSSFLVTRRH